MGTQQTPATPLWVGVDVGTQSLRVLLVDDAGELVSRGASRLTSYRDGRRHEQDPAQWWRALGLACRQALDDAEVARPGATRRIQGLAMCGTSGTFLLAGPGGAASTRALMYDDSRAGPEAAAVAEAGADLWASLGHRMQPSWALPKLLWLLRHRPDLRAEVVAGRLGVRHCVDYLAERLTGTPVATDWSHALKSGYDLDHERWPDEVLDKLGIPPDALPPVVRPGAEIGRVDAAGAAHTGLPVGASIRAGMSDGCAAQIAAGALTAGAWNSVLGTTLVLKGVTRRRITDPAGAVYSHRHPDGGWLPGGASSTGAAILEQRFPGADRDQLDVAAARHEPSGAIIYPLAGRGERFPFVRSDADPFELGSFVDDGDRYAGLLQGVAYVEKLCYAHLNRLGARIDGPMSMTGGATRSAYWCQLRADVLGREVVLPGCAEPAFGMAVLAAAGDGSVRDTAARMVRIARVIAPRHGGPERFAEAYTRFVDALAARGWISAGLAEYAKATA